MNQDVCVEIQLNLLISLASLNMSKNSRPHLTPPRPYSIIPRFKPSLQRLNPSILPSGTDLLIFGGTNSKDRLFSQVAALDANTLNLNNVKINGFVSREGQQVVMRHKHSYFWGGADSSRKVFNDLFRYDGSRFESSDQTGDVPCGRAYYRACVLEDRYLLLYGGTDYKTVFADLYLLEFEQMRWTRCLLNGPIPQLLMPSMTHIAGRVYLFGGQVASGSSDPQFSNRLYQISVVSLEDSVFQIREMRTHRQKISPCARANHMSLGYCDRYLMVMGGEAAGQGVSTIQTSNRQMNVLSDIWVYDCFTNVWMQECNLVSPRYGGAAFLKDSTILFVVGGCKSLSQMSDTLEVLYIQNDPNFKSACRLCRITYHLNQVHDTAILDIQSQRATPRLNLQFVESLAQLIKQPTQALGLLIDNSFNMGASLIKINMLQAQYLQISDNSRPFGQEDFMQAMFEFKSCRETLLDEESTNNSSITLPNIFFHKLKQEHEEKTLQLEYGTNLKLGALRLGSSMLYVNRYKNDYWFGLFNYQSPNFQDDRQFGLSAYYYQVGDFSREAETQRRIIANAIGFFGTQQTIIESFMQQPVLTKKIFVFRLRKKHYVPENDIKDQLELTASATDIFVNGTHFTPDRCILQRSIRAYISHLYLDPYVGRSILVQNSPVEFVDYSQKLKTRCNSLSIEEIDIPVETQRAFSRIRLYQSLSKENLKQEGLEEGILMYYNNRLFQRILAPKNCGLGYLELPHQIRLNILKTEIESKSFMTALKKMVAKQYVKLQDSSRTQDMSSSQGGETSNSKKRDAPQIILSEPKKYPKCA